MSIILSRTAEREFALLAKRDQKKIIRKLKSLKKEPYLGKKLIGELKGLRSLPAWPYRIIYEIYQDKTVVVHKILHRQRAYK